MSTREQINVAMLHGDAQRSVQLGLTVAEAVASLHEITEDPESMANAAGVLAGAIDPRSVGDYARRIQAARLLVAAGADRGRLAYWIGVGRHNATRRTGPGEPPEWPDDTERVLADVLGGQ